VASVTLPGSTTSVSAVTVDQGSASFIASKSGQAVAGLKNGIVVVSGTDKSQVTVDTTGATPKIGVANSDTIIVPTGAQNVSGTSVDLPAPSDKGEGKPVNVSVGGKEISIQASQPNTSMTFKVVDVGGVQTPVMEVTGAAQVSSSGDNQPIVSVGGNVIKTGKSGGSSQVCNTIVQASSDSRSDVVHVVTCYIVLDAGSFSGLGGGGTGNNFAAIKDGIVWAGETAEFDKSGKVTSAYLGTRGGTSDAVGDDLVPGGNKFAVGGYRVGAFIPRLTGTPLRLNGAKLNESIFAVIKKALNVTVLPSTPSQSAQGVLNFTFTGNLVNQGVHSANVTYTITSDTASILPSRRIRVDTSRADGLSISAEGEVDVATGGLVTTFAPSVADPKAFAEKISQILPGSTSTLRWNGSWQITAADGTTYVGRPQWSYWAAAPDAATFGALADGNVLYSDNGIAQPLFPDFYDYDTLQATFRTELKDPALTVLPHMDGTATATVNGQTYTLAPQWNVVKPAAGKPVWWVEGSVVYIKNADGTAQGFTVK